MVYHQMGCMANYRGTFHSISMINGFLSILVIAGSTIFAIFSRNTASKDSESLNVSLIATSITFSLKSTELFN